MIDKRGSKSDRVQLPPAIGNQPIMLRMKSDLVDLCTAACDGKLDENLREWDERASLGIGDRLGRLSGQLQHRRRITVCAGRSGYDGIGVFHAGANSPMTTARVDRRRRTRRNARHRMGRTVAKRETRLRPDDRHPLGRQLQP